MCSRPENGIPPGSLILIRHGQSDWNEKQLYTGRKDPRLTAKGIEEARAAGRLLNAHGLQFDIAFASELQRARHSLGLILSEIGQDALATIVSSALNERDYGELAGMTRMQARERWGKSQLRQWLEDFDAKAPGGESLSDTSLRVVAFFKEQIWSHVLAGRKVLTVGHRHSLLAIIRAVECLTNGKTREPEMPTGMALVYSPKIRAFCRLGEGPQRINGR